MNGRARGAFGLALTVVLLASCGGGSPSSAAPTSALAATFEEFAAENCAAAQALFRGYGNPDTAGLSPQMQAFEDALVRGDLLTATTRASAIKAIFEDGRRHARIGAGWAPGAPGLVHLDRILIGMTRMVDAELGAIAKGLAPAKQAGQAAFDAVTGPDDWTGWLEGLGAAMKAAGVAKLPACQDVPF